MGYTHKGGLVFGIDNTAAVAAVGGVAGVYIDPGKVCAATKCRRGDPCNAGRNGDLRQGSAPLERIHIDKLQRVGQRDFVIPSSITTSRSSARRESQG